MLSINLFKDLYLTAKGIYLYKTLLYESAYWSKDKMEAFQYEHLLFILKEAKNHVPYYKKLFGEIQFDPLSDYKELKDIEKIPVLTKEIARKEKANLVHPIYSKNAMRFRTSGSTGEPFEVFVSNNAWAIEQGVVWRHWKWSGYKFRQPMAMVRSFTPKNDADLMRHDKIRNIFYFSPFHLNDHFIEIILEQLKKNKISALRGYPSSIATIASYLHKKGVVYKGIKLILTASEHLSALDRKLIETAFNCRVTNHYGLAEICVMMGDCENHNGLHNYDDYGYLELHPTNNSKEKRIIGTNLHNIATPLIRYDTGDIAILKDESCGCGKTLYTVDNVLGRKDNVIITTSGFQIPTVNFYTMFENFQEIERWQIIQESVDMLIFIVKSNNFSKERKELLINSIKSRIRDSMNITIKINEPFIQKYEGKINPFVSYLQ
jgi:phenylacetate-CoA ligase